jgi:DNA-nicking Smr family endonuclease
VTATIRPLSREKQAAAPAVEVAKGCEAAQPRPEAPKPPRSKPAPQAQPQRPRPGTTLDGTWDRRLLSGSIKPDRVVDLHGHDLDRAWRAIDTALERAIASGERVILLVTGHHRPGEPPVQRGKIRAAVHDWLAASRHAPRIAAVRGAHRRHGGGGSLYIVLRRG